MTAQSTRWLRNSRVAGDLAVSSTETGKVVCAPRCWGPAPLGEGKRMAYDMFLLIDSIHGPATTAGQSGAIEVLSFSWGVSRPSTVAAPTGAGGGAGKASISSLNVMKRADQVSPTLFLACAQGTVYKTGSLRIVAAGASPAGAPAGPLVELDFTNVAVESVQWSGSEGSESPMESVSLAFARVTYKVAGLQAPGTPAVPAPVGWDLTANRAV